ncbi:amidohydrolase family protein [Variovorax sp. PBL-E5]|uniref:amidohydrolase family protein n=1 Tax=Variovorax sp. PBL-E5 TaxID=434014 RepID=UPI001316953C|nr:amidohydrolase family protein [Variovorax sp. PBL-E5]VTU23908.1 putative metal-dependent hydrolase of the TIM-barrel fold protein [Variovorax sp. PBL-E5]
MTRSSIRRASAETSIPDRRRFLRAGGALMASGVIAQLAACAHTPGTPAASAAPAARTGAIDMHAHWTPEPYAKAMAELGRPTFANGSALNPLMYDLPKRLEWMDQRNIRTHVLTLSGNMPWWWASDADAMRLAQLVNDSALTAHATYPERFYIGLAVPIKQPDAALRELNRMAGKPGVHAVGLPNSMNGQDYLFTPEYLPFLARCEELNLPLLFHPLDFPPNYYGGPQRLAGPSFLYNTLGFTFEHANTAEKFISSGYLDRFPRLQILLAHAGGAFPFIAQRLAHAVEKGASNVKLQHSYQEYVRRFYYDTLTYSKGGLRYLIDTVGIDRVVIGTDVFAAMDVREPMYLVDQLDLPAASREMILRSNALQLMHM